MIRANCSGANSGTNSNNIRIREKLDDPLHRSSLLAPAALRRSGPGGGAGRQCRSQSPELRRDGRTDPGIQRRDPVRQAGPDAAGAAVRSARHPPGQPAEHPQRRQPRDHALDHHPAAQGKRQRGDSVTATGRGAEPADHRASGRKRKPGHREPDWPRCLSTPASIRPACTCRPRRS